METKAPSVQKLAKFEMFIGRPHDRRSMDYEIGMAIKRTTGVVGYTLRGVDDSEMETETGSRALPIESHWTIFADRGSRKEIIETARLACELQDVPSVMTVLPSGEAFRVMHPKHEELFRNKK
jgi:hypothetical protein